ncbi:MAG: hypothetical protein IKW04_00540 [Clostridia bacterium]|nr:hypothetical protein [Clostridia bacterium]
MENNTKIRVVSFRDLWDIFIQKIWIIALVFVLITVGLFTVNTITFTPEYRSTATMYILRQNVKQMNPEQNNADEVATDFSSALDVVSDCDYLMKSYTVVEKVKNNLNLTADYRELSKRISTSNPENTRILEVSVTAESPEEAQRMVDDLCKVGAKAINETMGFEQIRLYESGNLNYEPCNKTKPILFVFVGLIAAVVTYSIFLVLFLLDTTIKSDEDIENYLGLSILGDIPEANNDKKNKQKYRYKYRRKGYGYGYINPDILTKNEGEE